MDEQESRTKGRAADPRKAPFIWITWVADLIAGAACQWRYWFLARNHLNERASTFDDPTWHIRHSRLLTELDRDLTSQGLDPEVESEFTIPLDKKGAQLTGRMDCLVFDPSTDTATVWDCKTGIPKPKDKIQVLLYMHCLAKRPRFRGKGIRGEVVYEDHREPISSLPGGFSDDVEYWLKLLLSESPPRKVPGGDCRYCPISRVDCPERMEDGFSSYEQRS